MVELTLSLKRFGFNRILLDRLESRKGENRYWSRAVEFVESLPPTGRLSLKQHNWLVSIVSDLEMPWE